jgi:hypothetical protein
MNATPEPYVITAKPDQWRFINAYDPFDFGGSGRPRFSVVLTDASLLPEEVANEANVSKSGAVYMTSFSRPAVEVCEQFGDWHFLEQELRRMEVTNQRPDALFKGATIEITFDVRRLEPRANSRFTTPLTILPVSKIMIVGYDA